MGLKRDAVEAVTWLFNKAAARYPTAPENPGSIFVLRNNDIGDLLVATPLFEALKRRFPQAKLVAGIGSWTKEILENNPFVDEVLPANAPWHNQRVQPFGLFAALRYLAGSSELKEIKRRQFEVGIDYLGSPFGSWLMMRAKIPWRLGVKGYAGGHTGVQQFVQFDSTIQVAQAGLKFASLLGAHELPEARPQLYLTATEKEAGGAFWSDSERTRRPKRVVVAPGGGYRAKCWPAHCYAELLKRITDAEVILIGGEGDCSIAEQIGNPRVRNLTGRLSLREVFSLIAAADEVICNSSMAMHVAAAFRKPCLVLLGEAFASADEHALLWGYPETRILGAEAGCPRIPSVEEAYAGYLSLL